MVLNYCDTVDFMADYRCAVVDFHDISDFHLRDVYKLPKTEQKLPQIPQHHPDIVKYQILYVPPPVRSKSFGL